MYGLIIDDDKMMIFDSIQIYGIYENNIENNAKCIRVLTFDEIMPEMLDPGFKIKNFYGFLFKLCKQYLNF